MTAPNCKISSPTSTLDTPEYCRDPEHYKNYAYPVQYNYNSRGFRDAEWPEDLTSAVWCVGDSFTSGVGVPLQHTWPAVLQSLINQRCINVSMDGASNNWIARQAAEIIKKAQPDTIVVQWSFLHRREQAQYQAIEQEWQRFYQLIKAPQWPAVAWCDFHLLAPEIQAELTVLHNWNTNIDDVLRRVHNSNCSHEQDINNTVALWHALDNLSTHTKIIHSTVPEFCPANYRSQFDLQLKRDYIAIDTKLDLARDGYHYDIKTATAFVKRVIPLLK